MARFNSKYLHKTYRIALASMMAALSLIVLYIGVLVPNLRVSMYFLSSIFVTPLLLEDQPSMAVLEYIAVSLLGLLIVPDLTMVLPYVLLFGHYGIAKYYIEKMTNKAIAYIFKMVYLDVFVVLIYLLARDIFLTGFFADMALWLVAVILEAAFVVFDFLYSKVTLYYAKNIRNKLMQGGK